MSAARHVDDVQNVNVTLCTASRLPARAIQSINRSSSKRGKGSPYSITERRVPELIPVLCSQPAGDVSHKPGGRLPLLFARPALALATLKRAAIYQFRCLVKRGTMAVNSLPKTVTRQRRSCDLNPGPSAPESSMLTTRLPIRPTGLIRGTKCRQLRPTVKSVVNANDLRVAK